MRRWWLVSAGLTTATMLVLVGSLIPVWTERRWMDPVTGSQKWEIHLFDIWHFESVQRESGLAKWASQHDVEYQSQWEFLFCTQQGAFWTVYECGPAPAVFPLAGSLGDEAVAVATDDELATLIQVLRHGTDSEKQRAVNALLAKVKVEQH